MNKLVLELISRRTIHLFLGSVVISSAIALLCVMNILPDGSGALLAGMCIGVILYAIFNIKMMRRVNFLVRSKSLYYLINFGAYFIFGLIHMCAYKLCSSYVFAWLFAITKFVRYTNLSLNIPMAVTVFHLVMVITILCAPIGMDWMYEMDESNAVERIPGMLEVNPLEQKSADMEVAKDENKNEEEKSALS